MLSEGHTHQWEKGCNCCPVLLAAYLRDAPRVTDLFNPARPVAELSAGFFEGTGHEVSFEYGFDH